MRPHSQVKSTPCESPWSPKSREMCFWHLPHLTNASVSRCVTKKEVGRPLCPGPFTCVGTGSVGRTQPRRCVWWLIGEARAGLRCNNSKPTFQKALGFSWNNCCCLMLVLLSYDVKIKQMELVGGGEGIFCLLCLLIKMFHMILTHLGVQCI